MRIPVLLALAAVLPAIGADQQLEQILNRVSEEAEAFRMLAPKVVARETLREKARKKRSRFRIRIGADALKPPPVKYQTREIISEYGFTTLREAPDALHELRQVVSVDGRPVTDHKKARETLTIGATSDDDRLKKKMLRRFAKLGLMGATTDFGQLILLFRRRHLGNYEFRHLRETRLGADRVVVTAFTQKEGPASLTIFEGRKATRARLTGEIWTREKDGLPLRITLKTTVKTDKHETVHRTTVDYFRSPYGVSLPAAVRYEKLVNGQLLVENVSSYTDYHMFAVETEIKFTPAEPPAK